jgi:hypothetical protein
MHTTARLALLDHFVPLIRGHRRDAIAKEVQGLRSVKLHALRWRRVLDLRVGGRIPADIFFAVTVRSDHANRRPAGADVVRDAQEELWRFPREGFVLSELRAGFNPLALGWRVANVHPSALLQGILQIGGSVVLLEQVTKRLISQFLKAHHAIASQNVERQPGLVIKLDALPGH